MKIESKACEGTIIIDYRQERNDADYGTCINARFYFDTESYRMVADSDLATGATEWVRTPKTESFMKLMARIGGERYLLYRLFGSPTEVDTDDVLCNVRELMLPDDAEEGEISDYYRERCEEELEVLKEALNGYETRDAVIAILERWDENLDEDLRCNDTYYLYECADAGYSIRQRYLVDVFYNHIQPYIQRMLKEGKAV